MTIQWSVLLWTVICFLLLVLILDRLLFRPVLELMDRRRERVRRAAEKKAEHERLQAEYAARQEEKRAAAEARQKKELRAQMDQVRSDGRSRVEAANLERVRRADGYRVQAEADRARLLELLSRHADEIAVSFAESMTK